MMPEKDNRTSKRKTGDLGENLACLFLVKRGFEIVEQNYFKPWGEIDIIAKKGQKLHFVEVKSVTRENLAYNLRAVSTQDNYRSKTNLSNKFVQPNNQALDCFRPEDNLHPWKLKRLSRIIQSYLLNYNSRKDVSCVTDQENREVDWQFDVITVYLDLKNKETKVDYLEDIIL